MLLSPNLTTADAAETTTLTALHVPTAVRIGFDISPGAGGPGRYVQSLVTALQRPEWVVTHWEQLATHVPWTNTTRVQPDPTKKLQRSLRWMIPRSLRFVRGFHNDARRAAQTIRAMNVHLFHAQNTGCEEMPVAARLAGVPHVLGTFHVDPSIDLQGKRSGWLARVLERHSNHSLNVAIAVSEATRQAWIRRSGLSPDRVITIHNGINPQQFCRRDTPESARRQLGLPPRAMIVGGLGRLAPAKGFSYLIEAVAMLRDHHPQLILAVAGQGPLHAELLQTARLLGLQDRVYFLGFQENVNLVLDAFDIFVQPSLCETLGYAVLEAMAHELPCVGTRVGGIPEVLVDGESGMLVPPRDAVPLARAISQLATAPELRQRLGQAARARVATHFQEADMVRRTINIYHRLLESPPSSRHPLKMPKPDSAQ